MRVFVNERYAYALSILATNLIKACLSLLFAVAVRKAEAQTDCLNVDSKYNLHTQLILKSIYCFFKNNF